MRFIESEGLYQEQRDRLNRARADDRYDYEERAGIFEYLGRERRGDAERHAYCFIQCEKGWNLEHRAYPR